MGRNRYDVIVIGGGLYGCVLALQARQRGRRVTLLEKESDLLRRASYANQARIHQGYHYPRSLLTALRSRVNFPRFAVDFAECVHAGFDKYYAVARHQSKVTADQFRLFCQRIGAPLAPAPRAVKELFDPVLIEEVFRVTEHAFDAVRLRQLLWRALHEAGVDVRLHARVLRIEPYGGELSVLVRGPGSEGSYLAGLVCNCTYSQINQVLQDSGLPLVPLKHELTEMALVRVPGEFQGLGITVMDGAFFSLMPFPPRGLHSLSHVRYTPHQYWQDGGDEYRDAHEHCRQASLRSRYAHMIRDARRYLPRLADCRYEDSLWEVKTVLPQSEVDDSRPILFRSCERLPGLVSVMGAKIDNVFDVQDRMDRLLGAAAA